MTNKALRYAYRYGQLKADLHPTISDAIADALQAFGEGTEALHGFAWIDDTGAQHQAFGKDALAIMRAHPTPPDDDDELPPGKYLHVFAAVPGTKDKASLGLYPEAEAIEAAKHIGRILGDDTAIQLR